MRIPLKALEHFSLKDHIHFEHSYLDFKGITEFAECVMSDKAWMLNAKAIRHAKDCINALKQELGVKLTLSHPDFIQLLHEYVEVLDSRELNDAYAQLIAMAGPGTILKSLNAKGERAVPLLVQRVVGDSFIPSDGEVDHWEPQPFNSQERVTANGKSYLRFRDGKEFKGLYRGQPNYQ